VLGKLAAHGLARPLRGVRPFTTRPRSTGSRTPGRPWRRSSSPPPAWCR
jgi:hypothetical protein